MSNCMKRVKAIEDAGIILKQHRDEIEFTYKCIRDGRHSFPLLIKTFVEIGALAGASLYVYGGLLAPGGRAIGIDDGKRGHKTRSNLKRSMQMLKADGYDPHWVRGNSHKPETRAALEDILQDRPIDFLHIDGDHSADGSRQDWEMYGPLVRKGGIVAFHDVRGKAPCHVDETWRTITDSGALTRVICCGPFRIPNGKKLHKSCGIGIVYI